MVYVAGTFHFMVLSAHFIVTRFIKVRRNIDSGYYTHTRRRRHLGFYQ